MLHCAHVQCTVYRFRLRVAACSLVMNHMVCGMI